jgi:hypothetical protein
MCEHEHTNLQTLQVNAIVHPSTVVRICMPSDQLIASDQWSTSCKSEFFNLIDTILTNLNSNQVRRLQPPSCFTTLARSHDHSRSSCVCACACSIRLAHDPGPVCTSDERMRDVSHRRSPAAAVAEVWRTKMSLILHAEHMHPHDPARPHTLVSTMPRPYTRLSNETRARLIDLASHFTVAAVARCRPRSELWHSTSARARSNHDGLEAITCRTHGRVSKSSTSARCNRRTTSGRMSSCDRRSSTTRRTIFHSTLAPPAPSSIRPHLVHLRRPKASRVQHEAADGRVWSEEQRRCETTTSQVRILRRRIPHCRQHNFLRRDALE